MRNIVILTDEETKASRIKWGKFGAVVRSIPELYQVVKEQRTDLILIDTVRTEITRPVATRIRRNNGLTEIWKLVDEKFGGRDEDDFFDGVISRDLGQQGISRKIKEIIEDKELLDRYGLIGRSGNMKALAQMIDRVAPTDVSVMIVGPSGSGKDLVARALHKDSPRSDKTFVAINCGALAEGLLESELFGHEKGAFTGSVAKREGLFHKAEGGTIFLDEISETKPSMQVKLLQVLEDGNYYPVGSSVPNRANVRVVAATNRDLQEAIADKEFREDLYFRISAVKLIVPPLINRRGDIQPLLEYFWQNNSELDYSDSALTKLTRYDWPGNVRQLRNFASRMIALKPSGLVDVSDVDNFLKEQHNTATNLPVQTGRTVEEAGQELIYRAILSMGSEIKLLRNLITANLPGGGTGTGSIHAQATDDSAPTMEEMEKILIEQVLLETDGNRKETAKRLGIGERTLYRKLDKFGLK